MADGRTLPVDCGPSWPTVGNGMKRYEQLADQIAELIRSGVLAPGERVPSVRHASRTYGVSPSTVFQAYYLLEDRGLIQARARSGYFVREHAKRPLHEPELTTHAAQTTEVDVSELVFSVLGSLKDPHTVPFGSAFPSPELFPLPRLARSMAHALRDMPGHAVIADCLTDNRVRTVADVRHAFYKCGGNMGTEGSVAFMFDRVGEIMYPATAGDADTVMMAALEAGAEDVESDDEGHWIYCADTDLNEVAAALEASLGESETAKLIWKPQAPTEVGELDQAQKLMKLIDTLEEDDDVQNVTGNFDIPEDVAAQLE